MSNYLQPEARNFKAAVYEVTGKSFLCPDDAPKAGEKVIAFYPLQAIDPMKKFAFVTNEAGETVSMSRKFMKLKFKTDIYWTRQPMWTAYEEKKEMIKEMQFWFMNLLKPKEI